VNLQGYAPVSHVCIWLAYRGSEFLTASLFKHRKGVKRYENLNFEKKFESFCMDEQASQAHTHIFDS
jgi:hypothetical protein